MKHYIFIITVIIGIALISCSVSPPEPAGPGDTNAAYVKSWQRLSSNFVSESNGTGTKIRIFNDEIYVSFQDDIYANHLSVRKYNGVDWIEIGGDLSTGLAYSSDMEISQDGTPYVAYSDGFPGPAVLQKKGEIFWSELQASNDISSANVANISLGIWSNEAPIVAFSDGSAGSRLTVSTYVPNLGIWSNLGVSGFTSNNIGFTDTKVIAETLYVAYENNPGTSSFCSLVKWNGLEWEFVGNPSLSTGGPTRYINLGFYQDRPLVSFIQADNSVHVRQYNGTSWSYLGSVFSTGSSMAYLEMNTEFSPLLVCPDEDHSNYVSVFIYSNNTWTNLGPRGFNGHSSAHTSIDVDSLGNVYVAFQDQVSNRIDVWVWR